jgi:hypothetical protein
VDVYLNPHVYPRAYVLGPDDHALRKVEIVSYRGDEVVIRATGPGTLVLADSWDAGWRADGFVVTPYEGFMRSVSLPAGSHEVRFVYRPW